MSTGDSTLSSEPRWIACVGCAGEIGLPADYSAPTVSCPNCGHILSLSTGLVWRPAPSTARRPRGSATANHPIVVSAGKNNSPIALTGFILGIASAFLYFIGLLPILAVIFSAIGLANFKPEIHKNKWMALTGLALGIIYTVMCLSHYGHLR